MEGSGPGHSPHPPHSRSDAPPPRGHGPSLRFHEWRAPAANAPARPLSPAPSAQRSQWERAGGVVVTCGRRCSVGGHAPRHGGRFIAPFAAPARAAPQSSHPRLPRPGSLRGDSAWGCPALRRGVLPSGEGGPALRGSLARWVRGSGAAPLGITGDSEWTEGVQHGGSPPRAGLGVVFSLGSLSGTSCGPSGAVSPVAPPGKEFPSLRPAPG